MRLGIGNMVAATFGGIANGINLGSSFANHRSGARTPFSLVAHSAVIVMAIAVFTPLIVHMPRVVISAMLVAVAIQLVDRWTLQIVRKLLGRDLASAQSVLLDLLIIMIVAVVAIALDIVIAVVIGFAVTILFFLFRMSKSVIRHSYRCDVVHSRKTREPALMDVLAAHGAKILVLELEGPIFFGTAENLAAYLESAGQRQRFVRDPRFEARQRGRQHRCQDPALHPRPGSPGRDGTCSSRRSRISRRSRTS
jgi:MFS superfamily sulfate permease-like transporter